MSNFVTMAFGGLIVLALQDRRWAQIALAAFCGLSALGSLLAGNVVGAVGRSIGLLWLWQPKPTTTRRPA